MRGVYSGDVKEYFWGGLLSQGELENNSVSVYSSLKQDLVATCSQLFSVSWLLCIDECHWGCSHLQMLPRMLCKWCFCGKMYRVKQQFEGMLLLSPNQCYHVNRFLFFLNKAALNVWFVCEYSSGCTCVWGHTDMFACGVAVPVD